jgi:hypothetical protein
VRGRERLDRGSAWPHSLLEQRLMPDLDSNRKRRNWLVLVVLGALAALLYAAVVLKFAGYRF